MNNEVEPKWIRRGIVNSSTKSMSKAEFEKLYTAELANICPTCNLDLSKSTGYVCSLQLCPVYPKTT